MEPSCAIASIERQIFPPAESRSALRIVALAALEMPIVSPGASGIDGNGPAIELRRWRLTGQPYKPKELEFTQYRRPARAQRRAVAKFHGLLRGGRNRK
jgi:hypothetical protein